MVDPDIERLRAKYQEDRRTSRFIPETKARTGRLSSDTAVNPDPKVYDANGNIVTNKTWVRIGATQSNPAGRSTVPVWNFAVKTIRADTPVILVEDDNGDLYIDRADAQAADTAGIPSSFFSPDEPPPQLSDVVIEVANVFDIMPYHESGLLLRARPGWLPNGTYWADTLTNNLTSAVTATSGAKAYVMSGIDLSDNTWVNETTQDRGLLQFPSFAGDIEAMMAANDGIFWVSAVPLANGATTFTNADIIDLRGMGAGALTSSNANAAYSSAAASTPPTQEELVEAFGDAWEVGTSFLGLLDANGIGTKLYAVRSDGIQFNVVPMAVPASELATGTLTRQGTVLSAGAGDGLNVYEPYVLYDTEPQLLTTYTHVYKMWASNGWDSPALIYLESPDGENWTRYDGNPIITGFYRSAVVKHAGVYYLFAAIVGHARIDVWSSSDGINFVSLATSIITTGSGWKSIAVANMDVFVEGGTWYMYYEASGTNWAIGLATASAPQGPWTDYVSNPVISESGKARGGPHVTKIGSTYWMLCHGNVAGSGSLPTDLLLYHSTDRTMWTSDGAFLLRNTADEGPNPSSVGQLADPSFLIRNGVLMVWHAASSDGSLETAGQHIKLVTGAATLLDPDYPAPVEQAQRVIAQVTDGTLDELIFRIDDGTGNIEYSRDDGATWVAVGSGTVEGVTGTTPITVDNTDPANPIVTHATSGVTPGTYTSVTVNDKGHVTAGSNPATGIYGPISNGSSNPLILNSNNEIILSRRA